jgi:cytochrome b subunit of formate dehydrogenase
MSLLVFYFFAIVAVIARITGLTAIILDTYGLQTHSIKLLIEISMYVSAFAMTSLGV